MGYIEDNLVTGENVTYRARLHWRVLIVPVLVSALIVVISAILLVNAMKDKTGEAGTIALVALAVLVVGDIPLLRAILQRRAAEFAVTNRRVILKAGIVRRRTVELFLERIESIGVDQTVWGRLLNYGTITLHGTGGTSEPFHNISHPLEFRKHIQERIALLQPRAISQNTGA